MLGPGWEAGCPSCSLLADHFDGMAIHLAQRDVSFVVVSRAPLAEIEKFKKRMGWKFKWVSSFGNDFNFDYQVSASPEEKAKRESDLQLRGHHLPERGASRRQRVLSRTMPARSFTPIRPTDAASTSSSAPTTSSTWRRKAATRRVSPTAWPGSAITTATTARSSIRKPRTKSRTSRIPVAIEPTEPNNSKGEKCRSN